MDKKIKLIIFPGNFLPHIGGLETHVDNFVKYLSKNENYDITIITPKTAGGKTREVIHNNVKVRRYPAFEIVFNYPFPKFWSKEFRKIKKEIYNKEYDIVMTRTMFFVNSVLGYVFAKWRKNKIKLVHVEHASDYSKLDSKIKTFVNILVMKTLGRLILKHADKIIGVSNGTKFFLENSFNIKNVKVIRRGVEFEKIYNIKKDKSIRKKYSKKIILSFVGRLIDGKGVQDLIVALKNCKKKFICLIMGDGEYRSKLESLVKENNLEEKILFLGKTPYEKVISILKSSDIFINPSYTEGLPTSVLDALFSRTRVIATNVGGTYEILGKEWNKTNHFLIKEKNPILLLKTINKVITKIENNEKYDFKTIQKEIEKKFNWENHVREYDKILQGVVK
jgi:glycosyltransferase involved in cell wall biosynthesis